MGLAGIAVLLVLFLALPAALGAWLWRTHSAERSTEPQCGRCEYIVVGLSPSICPECGADLREVGVVHPRQRRRRQAIVAATAWSLALVLPAMLGAKVVERYIVPRYHSVWVERKMDIHVPSVGRIEASFYGTRLAPPWVSQVPPDQVPLQELTLRSQALPGQTIPLQVDWGQKICHYSSTLGPFNEEAIIAWLGATGADTGDPLVRQCASHVLQVIDQMPDPRVRQATGAKRSTMRWDLGRLAAGRPMLTAGPLQVFTFKTGSDWLVPLLLAYAGLVLLAWGIGLWRIARYWRCGR